MDRRRPQAEPSDPNGSLLGRYRLHERIGAGAHAEVFAGTRALPDGTVERVAIKRPRPGAPRALHQRLLARARAAAQHPHLGRVLEVGEDDAGAFAVLERAERDLGVVLAGLRQRDARLELPAALRVVADVARGLDQAHAQRRDGKRVGGVAPGNILITGGVLQLSPFCLEDLDGADDAAALAPEQHGGGPVDARADLYALGLVLYELVTGRPPSTVTRAGSGFAFEPPSTRVPGLLHEVDAIIVTSLARDPSVRYQSAGDLYHDLETVLHERMPRFDRARLAVLLGGVAGPSAPPKAPVKPPPPITNISPMVPEGDQPLPAVQMVTAVDEAGSPVERMQFVWPSPVADADAPPPLPPPPAATRPKGPPTDPFMGLATPMARPSVGRRALKAALVTGPLLAVAFAVGAGVGALMRDLRPRPAAHPSAPAARPSSPSSVTPAVAAPPADAPATMVVRDLDDAAATPTLALAPKPATP